MLLVLLSLVDLHLLILTTTDNTNLSIPLDAKDLHAIASNTTLAALAVDDKHALANPLAGIVASASEIPDAACTVVAARHKLVARVGIPRQRDDGVRVSSQRQCGDSLCRLTGVDKGDVLCGGTAGYERGVGKVADGEEGLRSTQV